MSYKLNPFTKKLDIIGSLPTVTSDPVAGATGDMILNTTTNTIKIYYDDTWQIIHTLATYDFILQETGDFLLNETGGRLITG